MTDLRYKHPELFSQLQDPMLLASEKQQLMQQKVQELKASPTATQDEIDLLMLQAATFEVHNRVEVVRSMQQKLDQVNSVINAQLE